MNEIESIKFKLNPIITSDDGNKYEVIIQIPMALGWIEDVNFIIDSNVYPMEYFKSEDNMAYFKTNLYLETKAIYHYYFSFKANGNLMSLKNKDNEFKLSVNFDVPDWAKGGIMYHIFLDRFNRGSEKPMEEMERRNIHHSWNEEVQIGPDKNGIWNNDFYGGDLKGVENQLEYLKSLGVNIIYLSPIVQSQSNHRYDAADYEIVDLYAGCNEDLKSLCDKAHKLDMKIVLDAVFNHTGNDSKYFNEYGTYPEIGAYQSLDSIYSPFFRKHEENGKIKYDYWWGMKNLPECDGNSIEWINYITGKDGIIDKWFSLGIDGLRLDVADELTDNFIKLIRKAVKRNKQDGFIIGEVWKNPMRMNREYISSGQEMDSVMNYVFIDALLRYFKYADVHKLSYTIKDILNEYPEDTIKTLMNFTSTHDITRAINLFASNEFDYYGEWAWNLNNNDYNWCKNYSLTPEQYSEGKKIYETYVFTLNFLPGILSIFYGDEIGMQGMGNLSNRKPYPKENYDTELLNFFKHMGKIRTNEPFLKEAELEIQDINEKYFVYERYNKENKILVAINRSDEETSFPIPKEYNTPSKVYTLKNSKPGYLSPHGAVAIKKS